MSSHGLRDGAATGVVATLLLFAVFILLTGPRASADPCTVDLRLFDGQGGVGPADADENTRGAFTVLNRNDTDKDGTEDLGQDSVAGETDLMKLVLNQTVPASEVAMLGVGGTAKVKLWTSSTKSSQVLPEEEGGGSYIFDSLPQTLWVEGIEVSGAVRDVSFSLTGFHKHPQPPPAPSPLPSECGSDTANATIIWAESTDVRHDRGNAIWGDFTQPPQNAFDKRCDGKVGLRPPAEKPKGVANCLAIQYTVSPPGVWNETGVRFDITRQRNQRYWYDVGAGFKLDEGEVVKFPKGDKPNDDVDNDVDSSDKPNASGHMYVVDGPGPTDNDASAERAVQRWNMLEYVRVRFDGQNFVVDRVSGSRCSTKFEWHATHRLRDERVKPGNDRRWIRTTGNQVEAPNTNDVAGGHVPNIGEAP